MAKSFDITTKTINIAYTPNGGSIVVRYSTGANPDTCSAFDLFNDTISVGDCLYIGAPETSNFQYNRPKGIA